MASGRPNQLTRHREATWSRVLSLLGILCTLALHGALYYGFRLPPPQGQREQSAREGSCTFVGAAVQTPSMAWEQRMREWVELMDPSAAAKDDEIRGFSRVRRLVPPPPRTPVPAYAFDIQLEAETAQPPIRLSRPLPSLSEELRTTWVRVLPPLPAGPPPAAFPKGIIWRTPRGEMVTDGPPLELAAVKQAWSETDAPRRPTRVEISRDGEAGQPRLRIRKSSGNTELDQVVLKALAKSVLPLALRARYQREETVRSYWPAPGGRREVEVDWAFLPLEWVQPRARSEEAGAPER